MKSKNGRIIGIVSIKGGVGKTTAVINLAAALSRDCGKKTIVVDANFSSPNLGLHLGMVNQGANLHTVLNDEILVHDSIYEHEFGFDVLPASLKNEKVNPSKLKNKISGLSRYYDFVLVDSSPSLNDELLATITTADELLIVTTPDWPTLSTTLRSVKLAKERGVPVLGLLLNHFNNKTYETTVEEIEKATKVPVIAVIPDDQKILEALAAVKPITLYSPHNKTSLEFRKLAAALAGTTFKEPTFLQRAASLLKEDLQNFKHHDFSKGLTYYR